MKPGLLHMKYASELTFLQGFLEEEGIHSTLLDSSHGLELPVLVAVHKQDGKERPVNFIFVPVDDELETLQLLQMYAQISLELDMRRLEALEKLILVLNRTVGLGSFGIDPENQLYYKYIFPKPRYESWNRELILETIFLFMFLLERFSGVLEAVASGEMTGAEAVEVLHSMQQSGQQDS